MNPGFMAVLGEGLKLLTSLVEHATPAAFDAAKAVIQSLRDMHDGHTSPLSVATHLEETRVKLEAMRAELAASDTAADAALHHRFNPGEVK